MEITCPKCRKPSKHNEAFLGPKGSILRCALCGGLIKIFNRGKSDEIGPAMWVVRKSGGEVVQVDRLSTLQKWILDGSVARMDELLRSGEGWVVLESVPELSGLLYLARLNEDARRAEMWKMPTLNIGTEAPARTEKKKKEKKPKEKKDGKEGEENTDDEDTVQIPGKVLEESIKLSEADEIITAEIVLLDEADREEVDEGKKKKKAEWDAAPMMLTDVVKPEKPKPKLEPVAEPPEPEKPVLEIAGEVTESPWTDEEEERKEEPVRRGRRSVKLALQITLIVVLALVAGAAYVHRERIYDWRHIFFPPPDQETTSDAGQVAGLLPEETPAADESPADAASMDGSVQTSSSEGDQGDEAEESTGKGSGLKGYDEHFKKALALQHAKDCARAVEFYRKAIEIDHRHTEAWTGIGECYEDLGKNLNAVNSFKSALHYNSKYGPALLGLADVLKKQGKLEAALDYYNRYLETSPGGSRVASVRKTVQEIEDELKGGGPGKKDPIGIPENPYGP